VGLSDNNRGAQSESTEGLDDLGSNRVNSLGEPTSIAGRGSGAWVADWKWRNRNGTRIVYGRRRLETDRLENLHREKIAVIQFH